MTTTGGTLGLGYTCYWFAEHHNMANIATSAPEAWTSSKSRGNLRDQTQSDPPTAASTAAMPTL
jgi:alkanesulfonate monooxygenase SsuD/methylene tetrahydromethanopterin reductase-like flavin-dependent oxidoreductase (luciferase family)